jgi:hypothetical protein
MEFVMVALKEQWKSSDSNFHTEESGRLCRGVQADTGADNGPRRQGQGVHAADEQADGQQSRRNEPSQHADEHPTDVPHAATPGTHPWQDFKVAVARFKSKCLDVMLGADCDDQSQASDQQ